MSHLTHLKRRIKSIQTTEKITHAMRLIAMSLYSKLEKQNEPLNHYIEHLQSIFAELLERCPEWENKTFLPNDILDPNPLFIVISATKGFCGGLNNHLFRYVEQKLHIEEHQSPTFLTLGNNFADISKNIAKIIVDGSYSSVTVYSSFFKNFFAQKPTISKVIPIEATTKDVDSQKAESESELSKKIIEKESPIWEQNNLEIINFVADRYLNARLTHIMFQALISEYASRFVAMDGATTNAEKYLETLTLQFNKLRQALITREVSELSASL